MSAISKQYMPFYGRAIRKKDIAYQKNSVFRLLPLLQTGSTSPDHR